MTSSLSADMGCRPAEERDDRQGRDASCSGRDGLGGVYEAGQGAVADVRTRAGELPEQVQADQGLG